MSQDQNISPGVFAVAYVRMSNDHQQYSTANQLEVIRRYAQPRGLTIGRIFSDEGLSGLTLQGRPALRELITTVLSGCADFRHILVYDVSRWGRFQDDDEAAHYEFVCRRAGVAVHYCAEEFPVDQSFAAMLAKSFKRAMAAEFSRELSAKVLQSTSRLARQGYLVGGPAVFGLRRQLLDLNGQPKMILNAGEQKQRQTCRVKLTPGPDHEIAVMRNVFKSFVDERIGPTEIARRLNQSGIYSASGRPWTEVKIRVALRNERYIGNMIYARRTNRLGTRSVENPPDQWIRKQNAFPAIVSRKVFHKAQERFSTGDPKFKYSWTELLDKLREFHRRHGRVNQALINATPDMPGANAYMQRFGSLVTAYKLTGLPVRRPYRLIHEELTRLRGEMITAILSRVKALGGTAVWQGRHRQILLNGHLRIRVLLVRHCKSQSGCSTWRIHHQVQTSADMTLVARLDANNESIKDFYLLPRLEGSWEELHLMENNGVYLDAFRFSNLDFLARLGAAQPQEVR